MAIIGALAGCDTPTWVVLRPKCPGSDGGANAACEDAGPAPAQKCLKDLECVPGELCVMGACRACDKQPVCATCELGTAPVTYSINGCTVCGCAANLCKTHADCPEASVCEGNKCVPCDASASSKCPDTCPWNWKAQPLKRNGCAQCECAPLNACQADADCGLGLHCYRGQLCQDGCTDLGCCFGNFCSQPGCEDAPLLSCSLVGCGDGTCTGDASCDPTVCKCDGKTFQCPADCTNAVCKL